MMATIAPPPPPSKPLRDRGGNLPPRGLPGEDGGHGRHPDSGQRYYTGMVVGLGAVVMLFAAFTSAYIVRQGLSDDWQPFSFPALIWPNTLLLLASSLTLEKARRSLDRPLHFRRWWRASVGLGTSFLLGQLLIWRQLAADGVYLGSNPSSSFFYVLTAAHGLHLLGGVMALLYVSAAIWRRQLRIAQSTAVGVTALYWHFMDGLWIYLLLLLLVWR